MKKKLITLIIMALVLAMHTYIKPAPLAAGETGISFSELDSLGRCGKAEAVLGRDCLAEGKRGSIGMYKPSGWPERIGNAKYDFIDGKYLFNRCHLIGWQLYGDETNDERNLITGTRQFNVEGMLPYENEVANYLKGTNNHVRYTVTPDFKDNELIPRGVQMTAVVEETGRTLFDVYVENVQDGVEFDYYNGESRETVRMG